MGAQVDGLELGVEPPEVLVVRPMLVVRQLVLVVVVVVVVVVVMICGSVVVGYAESEQLRRFVKSHEG